MFRINTLGGPRNIMINGGPGPPTAKGGKFDAAFAILPWQFTVGHFPRREVNRPAVTCADGVM